MTDTQLTAADLTDLTTRREFQQIEDARLSGRLDRLLGMPEDQIELLDRARHARIDSADVSALMKLNLHDLVENARTTDRIDYQEN